jgi:hypothetical protein
MALASLSKPLLYPDWGTTGLTAFSNVTVLDASGEYNGFVFRARTAMTISHVGYRTSTVAGSPTVEIRIETVNATTGLPTGDLWNSSGANNTNVTSATLSSNTWYLDALTGSASISAGDYVAVLFKYASGTSVQIARANNWTFNAFASSSFYNVTNTGGSGAKASGQTWCVALGSSSTSFYDLTAGGAFLPLSAINARTASTSTNTAVGIKFQIPFKGRCIGWRHIAPANWGDIQFGLYDSSKAELSSSSTSLDMDMNAQLAGQGVVYFFDNAVTLDAATTYYFLIYPQTTTTTGVYTANCNTTDYRSAMPGGTNWHYVTQASGGGSWTETATTEFPLIDLVFDRLDDGAGGGGGSPFGGGITGLHGITNGVVG